MGDASKAKKILGWETKSAISQLVRIMVDADMELLRMETPRRHSEIAVMPPSGSRLSWTRFVRHLRGENRCWNGRRERGIDNRPISCAPPTLW